MLFSSLIYEASAEFLFSHFQNIRTFPQTWQVIGLSLFIAKTIQEIIQMIHSERKRSQQSKFLNHVHIQNLNSE